MDGEQRVPAPVDFQVVGERGIHPFYLEMEIGELLLSAVSWKIAKVELDIKLNAIHIEFWKNGGIVEVSIINMVFGKYATSSYVVYGISTSFAKLGGNVSINKCSMERVVIELGLIRDPIDDVDPLYDDPLMKSYASPTRKLIVYFHKGGRHSVNLSIDLAN